MTSKYVHRLRRAILDNDLTNTETKIFFYLLDTSRTSTMLAKELSIPQPTIGKATSKLQKLGLLKVDRIEGRNKFLSANLDALPADKGDE